MFYFSISVTMNCYVCVLAAVILFTVIYPGCCHLRPWPLTLKFLNACLSGITLDVCFISLFQSQWKGTNNLFNKSGMNKLIKTERISETLTFDLQLINACPSGITYYMYMYVLFLYFSHNELLRLCFSICDIVYCDTSWLLPRLPSPDAPFLLSL